MDKMFNRQAKLMHSNFTCQFTNVNGNFVPQTATDPGGSSVARFHDLQAKNFALSSNFLLVQLGAARVQNSHKMKCVEVDY